MGLFGAGDTAPVKTDIKTCPNCGKPLEGLKTVWKENGHFCCDKCCEAGPRIEEKKKQKKDLTCEFC